MSRSYRNPHFQQIVYGSDTKDRRLGNRRLRRINKSRVRQGLYPLVIREVSNKWTWPSDGGKYYRSSERLRDYPKHPHQLRGK